MDEDCDWPEEEMETSVPVHCGDYAESDLLRVQDGEIVRV